MAHLITNDLKNTIAAHLIEAGQIPNEQELIDYADSLVHFFEILIEADKKLMKANDASNNRDPNTTD